VTVCNM